LFIAIVTYTPRLTWSESGYVPGKRLQTELGPISSEQSDTCLEYEKIFSSFKKQRWITLVDFMFVQRMTADWHSVMFANKLLLKDKAVNCTGSDSSYCKV